MCAFPKFRAPSKSLIVEEEECRTIPLTQGQSTIVWKKDYADLAVWNWRAWWNKGTKSFYAIRSGSMVGGKRGVTVYMHREILKLQKGDKRLGDHRNHDTLDNRRSNIRIVTRVQNSQNMRTSKLNTSGFKGVYLHRRSGKWLAQIKDNKKWVYLGQYDSAESGYAAYCAAAKKYHGEFARTA